MWTLKGLAPAIRANRRNVALVGHLIALLFIRIPREASLQGEAAFLGFVRAAGRKD